MIRAGLLPIAFSLAVWLATPIGCKAYSSTQDEQRSEENSTDQSLVEPAEVSCPPGMESECIARAEEFGLSKEAPESSPGLALLEATCTTARSELACTKLAELWDPFEITGFEPGTPRFQQRIDLAYHFWAISCEINGESPCIGGDAIISRMEAYYRASEAGLVVDEDHATIERGQGFGTGVCNATIQSTITVEPGDEYVDGLFDLRREFENGRVVSTLKTFRTPGDVPRTEETSYQYDDQGRLIQVISDSSCSITWPSGCRRSVISCSYPNGLTAERIVEYDDEGRPVSSTSGPTARYRSSREFEWGDDAVSARHSDGSRSTYFYDQQRRIASAVLRSDSDSGTATFEYSPNGLLRGATVAWNSGRSSSQERIDYVHDESHNVTGSRSVRNIDIHRGGLAGTTQVTRTMQAVYSVGLYGVDCDSIEPMNRLLQSDQLLEFVVSTILPGPSVVNCGE